MDKIYCDKCGKHICNAVFPWDAGDTIKYYCRVHNIKNK